MTLSDIEDYAGGRVDEVVRTFVWTPETADGRSYGVSIRIEILRDTNGRFRARPDRQVKTRQQATPYVSMELQDSAEDALMDCIRGFRMFMGTPEETTFPRFPDEV